MTSTSPGRSFGKSLVDEKERKLLIVMLFVMPCMTTGAEGRIAPANVTSQDGTEVGK